jgi:hypothetical protein
MMSHNTPQAALLAALQAIVTECMDYPPQPRYCHDSYLPPHLLAAAQAAIELAQKGADHAL